MIEGNLGKGGMIAPLEARLLGDALQRARRAHVGAHADLVVATVAAPLPGLDYHVHDALFLGESKIWAVLEALLDDFGAAPAFAALGVGNLRADLCGSNLQPDFNVRVCDRFDARPSSMLRELDESNRFVQRSAESTLI